MIQKFDANFTNFNDIQVDEIDKDSMIDSLNIIKDRINNATDANEAINAIKDYFTLSDDIQTACSLVFTRFSQNSKDEKYVKLNEYLDENLPLISQADNAVSQAIYNCKYRDELVNEFGTLYFEQIALSLKTFSDEIVPLLVEENKCVSEYKTLVSSALIDFNGEKYSLSQLGKFRDSLDYETRKNSNEAFWNFYKENDDKIGDIFDRMIKIRTKIAKTLGYEDFVQLGYDRMGRLDWDKDDALVYRNNILRYIVPLSNDIFNKQKERLGFGENTKYYDYNVFYKNGNPTPKGSSDELVSEAKKMYESLSPVASKYFNFMVDHNCMDLVARANKSGGGYMEYLPSLKTSFIFSNFNGTSGDIDVLTHEFGHALQGFLAGEDITVPSYRSPGLECCEMHSMSMEFLTYPYMDLFFKEDADKYKYMHLCSAITFIPYGCIVDAFQTYCYTHPHLTHEQRKAYFRTLERRYLPNREYEDNEFLQSGGYFERQAHIFESPLYYLDYTIAQVVALEFFKESLENKDETLNKYINFCKMGGKYPFRTLLKQADIKNPMDGDTLKEVAASIYDYLNTFDPNNL